MVLPPTNILVTGSGIGDLYLTWTVAAAAEGYNLYRSSTNTDGDYVLYKGTDVLNTGTMAAYLDGTYANNATKFYKMSSYNLADGESVLSGYATGTTLDHPDAPTLLSVTPVSIGTLRITWEKAITGRWATGFEIYIGTVLIHSLSGSLVQTYNDGVYANNVEKTYKVVATNAIGSSDASNEITGTTWDHCNAPVWDTLTGLHGAVRLLWDAPTDTGDTPVLHYHIYSGTESGVLTHTDSTIDEVLTYTKSGLADGTRYYFKVLAVNAVGDGTLSAEADALTLDVPTVPLTFAATGGHDLIDLTWTPPASDGGSVLTRYNIYIGTVCVSTDFGTEIFVWTQAGVGDGVSRTYTISAVNDVGEGPQSAQKTGTTWVVPTAPVLAVIGRGDKELILTWTKPADGGGEIYDYKIYIGTLLIDTVIGSDVLTYTDTGLNPAQSVSYNVKARNAVGESLASNIQTGVTYDVPTAPRGLSEVDGDARVLLTWTAPSSDGGSAITGYQVWRAPTLTGTYVLINSPAGTSYTNTGLTNGATYWYKVLAVNLSGTSVFCTAIKAEPKASAIVATNKDYTACGAVYIAVYNLSGAAEWTLSPPLYKTLIGISTSFASDSNYTGTLSIVTNLSTCKVTVYDGASKAIDLYDVTAVLYMM
jgi:hypothetical protein